VVALVHQVEFEMAQQPALGVRFERQRLLLCAKHALNNMLQDDPFDRAELDAIAVEEVVRQCAAPSFATQNADNALI
jgi:hypothetical protein